MLGMVRAEKMMIYEIGNWLCRRRVYVDTASEIKGLFSLSLSPLSFVYGLFV